MCDLKAQDIRHYLLL